MRTKYIDSLNRPKLISLPERSTIQRVNLVSLIKFTLNLDIKYLSQNKIYKTRIFLLYPELTDHLLIVDS